MNFPRKAFEYMQDELFLFDDEHLREVLEGIIRFAKEERRTRRNGEETSRASVWDRETALTEIRRAQLKLDDTVVRFHGLNRKARMSVLMAVVVEARQVYSEQDVTESNTFSRDQLILPGLLFRPDLDAVAFDTTDFDHCLPPLQRVIKWSAREAGRLSERYGIREQMAVFALYLEEAFVSKPAVDWQFEPNAEDQTLSRLHLIVDPAMSPEEVAREYNEARQELGIANVRSLREKTYALAAMFANIDEKPDWWEWLPKWNDLCRHVFKRPEWAGSPKDSLPSPEQVHQFAREVRQSLRSLAGPEVARRLLKE